jgi:hypothetical protein
LVFLGGILHSCPSPVVWLWRAIFISSPRVPRTCGVDRCWCSIMCVACWFQPLEQGDASEGNPLPRELLTRVCCVTFAPKHRSQNVYETSRVLSHQFSDTFRSFQAPSSQLQPPQHQVPRPGHQHPTADLSMDHAAAAGAQGIQSQWSEGAGPPGAGQGTWPWVNIRHPWIFQEFYV